MDEKAVAKAIKAKQLAGEIKVERRTTKTLFGQTKVEEHQEAHHHGHVRGVGPLRGGQLQHVLSEEGRLRHEAEEEEVA